MAYKSEGEAQIQRFAVSADLSTRTLSTGVTYVRDTYVLNGYYEKDDVSAEDTYVIKRPALQAGFTYGGGTAGYAQGMFGYSVNGKQYLFAISGNTLYNVQGGQSFGSSSLATWITQTPAPSLTNRDQNTFSVIVFNKNAYVIGGSASGAFTSNTQYSTDGKTWNTINNSPQWAQQSVNNGRSLPNLAVLNSTLFLMNGSNAGLTAKNYNDCWSSTDGAFWTQMTADMGYANGINGRRYSATATFNGNILLMGGIETTQAGVDATVNTVISSADGANWTKNLTPSWSARQNPAACVHKGALYLMGGYDGASYLADCWKTTDGNYWTNVYSSGLAGGRIFQSLVSYQGKLYAFAYNSGANVREVYSSPDGVTWTPLATPPWAAGNAVPVILFLPPINYYAVQFPGETLVGVDAAANRTYFGDLDTAWSASYAMSSGAATTEQWQSTTLNFGQYLVVKNTADAWVFSANQVTKITDPNYPGFTVAGMANLNSRIYVMDTKGVIWGSNINDPTTWNGLNYIQSAYTSDAPIAIAVHNNMVVAFRTNSMLFFYDNGTSVGNTLSNYITYTQEVGCIAADSIVQMAGTLIFMSAARGTGRSVSMLVGPNAQMVSTPEINRLLDNNPCATVQATPLYTEGHDWYVLSLTDATTALPNGVTLIYDVQYKEWFIWSCGADGIGGSGTLLFRGMNRAGAVIAGRLKQYVQDRQTKQIFQIDPASYQDTDNSAVNTAITVTSQGAQIDFDTYQPKFCSSIDIISDRYSSTNNVTITKSDDDSLSTQTLGVVDLSLVRPRITSCGSFLRRTINFTHTDNMPLRMIAYELTVLLGTI